MIHHMPLWPIMNPLYRHECSYNPHSSWSSCSSQFTIFISGVSSQLLKSIFADHLRMTKLSAQSFSPFQNWPKVAPQV